MYWLKELVDMWYKDFTWKDKVLAVMLVLFILMVIGLVVLAFVLPLPT